LPPVKSYGIISDTRTEADFVAFMQDLFASAAPDARWRIVCDNLVTHMSEGITCLVAQQCAIKDGPGEEGRLLWRYQLIRA
jgi:hypothetical protein